MMLAETMILWTYKDGEFVLHLWGWIILSFILIMLGPVRGSK